MANVFPLPATKGFIDLTGKRFGRLLVQSYQGRIGRRGRWACTCDCGQQAVVDGNNLKAGKTSSCGCGSREGRGLKTHGGTGTDIYRIWLLMIVRCTKPQSKSFPRYGGRGIRVCERWSKSFAAFRDDMGPRPPGTTIDRKDNDGDYAPENCRWATQAQQTRNTSRNRKYSFDGETLCATDWARKVGMKVSTLFDRLERGLTIEEAITSPLKERKAVRP